MIDYYDIAVTLRQAGFDPNLWRELCQPVPCHPVGPDFRRYVMVSHWEYVYPATRKLDGPRWHMDIEPGLYHNAASTLRLMWAILPASGPWFPDAVPHDEGYGSGTTNCLRGWKAKAEIDRRFRDGMRLRYQRFDGMVGLFTVIDLDTNKLTCLWRTNRWLNRYINACIPWVMWLGVATGGVFAWLKCRRRDKRRTNGFWRTIWEGC